MNYTESDRVIDELLVLHILGGDQRAVDRLGVRWHPRLFRVARYLTRDDDMAAEAAQDAWVGISRSWIRLSDSSNYAPWAFGILRRKCIDLIRAKKRGADRFAAMAFEDVWLVDAPSENKVALRQAFATLSADHRAAAYLFLVEGLTLAEIAAATDVPIGTVKSRVFHARQHLKAHLSGDPS